MIRFLICNVFISGIIGILLIAKRIFKNNLSSRMQYNLWFLLLGLLAVPFIPFRLIGFPQIFSWLGSLRSSPASGTATAMGEAVGIAAALCVKNGCTPRQLDVKLLQDTMTEAGIELFD